MNTTKLLTILIAALVASAGAGAAAVQTDAGTSIDASYDDGTVEVTVTQNGSAVENVSVEANGEAVGTTDANGTLWFEANASEELELEFEGETVDLERTYAIEDGELVEADENDNAEPAGPNENASDRAHSVFAVVQEWLNGDQETSLGQLIQDQVGNDDAPGNSGNAADNSTAAGNSDDAPNNDDDDEEDGEDDEDEDDDSHPGNGNGNGADN